MCSSDLLTLTIDGAPVADAAGELARLVGPIDRTTYESLFAFGLDDLTGLGRKGTDELIAEVLGPAIGPFAALAGTRAALRRDLHAHPEREPLPAVVVLSSN